MARVYQVPQHAFVWLVSAVLLAALPHLINGPVWLGALLVLAIGWRIMVQRGRLRLPGRFVRLILLLAATGATLYTYGTVLGPEAGVCLLVAAFGLKLLETIRLRDAYVVIVLAYFVLATVFLGQRGILATLYVLVVLLVVTAALVGINHAETGVRARSHLAVASGLLGQAIPLTLVLFLLVPRIAPLWSLELEQGQARTGMSDSMAPGEVSRLSQSDELAFRVEFSGDMPPPSQRYWRGLTYSWFDGRRWSQAVPREMSPASYVSFPGDERPQWYRDLASQRSGPGLQYRVVMEPSRRRWLYALAVPFAQNSDIGMARDVRLVAREEVTETFAYQVSSYPEMSPSSSLSRWERRLNLYLPDDGNPRARDRARQWYREQGDDDSAFARRVLRWFREESFWYTLEPPPLGENTVDEFLFGTRRGFCEHYASAFVFLMRAAGIPARIVAGYQGGEVNPMGNHIRVRQRDAHAWAEVWLQGQGWTRFDPTGAVAPSRIEYGIDRTLEESEQGGGAIDALRQLRNNSLVRQLRHLSDYMQFAWQKWVLGYNQQTQMEFLQRWLGSLSPTRMGIALLVALSVMFVPIALWVLLRYRAPGLTPGQREYWRMVRLLRSRAVPVTGSTAPREMVERVSEIYPRATGAMRDWSRYYEGLVYGELSVDGKVARRHLRRRRQALKRRLTGRPGGVPESLS